MKTGSNGSLTRLAAERVFNAPLLIEAGRLQAILHAIGPRIGTTGVPEGLAIDLAAKPLAARSIEERRRRRQFAVEDGIAVIDIFGTLVHRAAPADAMSGGPLQYVTLRDELIDAATDPEIKGILLNIDSGGGEAGGCFDLADDIENIAGLKPTWAIADSMAFSAAFCLASQAQRVVITQDAGVGSVGVIALHVDQSEFDKAEGVKVTAIYAGAHKNDLSPHQPLSDAGRETLINLVEDTMRLFVGKVARGRGMAAEAVARTEAGLFFGRDAINVGFADSIGTFASTFAELRDKVSGVTRERVALNAKPPGAAPAQLLQPEVTAMQDEKTPAGVEAAQPPVAAGGGGGARAPLGLTAEQSEIVELCKIGGLGEAKALEFITAGLTPAKVRAQIVSDLAEAQRETDVNASTMPSDGMNVNAGFLASRMKATLLERGVKPHGA